MDNGVDDQRVEGLVVVVAMGLLYEDDDDEEPACFSSAAIIAFEVEFPLTPGNTFTLSLAKSCNCLLVNESNLLSDAAKSERWLYCPSEGANAHARTPVVDGGTA